MVIQSLLYIVSVEPLIQAKIMNPQDFKALIGELKQLNDNFSRLNASVVALKDVSFDLRSIASFLEKIRLGDQFDEKDWSLKKLSKQL